MAGNLQGESVVPQPLPDLPHSPLGLTIPDKIKSRIIADQYVEFFELLPSTTSVQTPEVSIAFTGSTASVTSNKASKKVYSIEQWTDAWLVFASIYLERHPDRAVELLRYAETIRDMSRWGPNLAWRFYDEQFRQTKACQPIPWGAPLGYLYLRCMTPKHQIGRSMPFRPQQEQSPRSSQWRGRPNDRRYPVGYCFAGKGLVAVPGVAGVGWSWFSFAYRVGELNYSQ